MPSSAMVRFDALTGLRAVAACWVLGHHLRFYFPAGGLLDRIWSLLFDHGYLGVDLFFVLSGFVLMHNYGTRGLLRDASGYSDYLRNRLARIYPAHLATLLLLLLVVGAIRAADLPLRDPDRYDPAALVPNLLLVQAWALPPVFTWNINAWSISAEWAAYLLFPVLAGAALRLQRPGALWLAILALWTLLGVAVQVLDWPAPAHYALPRVLVGFTVGVLTHRLWTLDWGASWPWARLGLGAALAMLGLGAVAVGPPPTTMVLAAPFTTVLVYALARDATGWARQLTTPTLLFWGGASYALFLVHRVVLVAFQHFAPVRELGAWQPLWVLLVVLVSFALAAWLYQGLEVPARRWLRRTPLLRATR